MLESNYAESDSLEMTAWGFQQHTHLVTIAHKSAKLTEVRWCYAHLLRRP